MAGQLSSGSTVTTGPGRFYAVELANDAALLAAADSGTRGFYASWLDQPLLKAPTFVPPQEAWERLATMGRVYYRLQTSRDKTRWVDATASTPDHLVGDAPSVRTFPLFLWPDDAVSRLHRLRVWERLRNEPAVADHGADDQFEVLLCRYARSPRRPVTPGALEWVVMVTRRGSTKRSVESTVLGLGFETLELRHMQHLERDRLGAGLDAAAAAAVAQRDVAASVVVGGGTDPSRWQRLGSVWIWHDPTPTPESIGGLVLVHALTGQLGFVATTEWGGGHVRPREGEPRR